MSAALFATVAVLLPVVGFAGYLVGEGLGYRTGYNVGRAYELYRARSAATGISVGHLIELDEHMHCDREADR